MQEPLTINGTVVERAEALASAEASAETIISKLALAAKHAIAAALELLAVHESETYFALVADEELQESGSKSAWVTFYKLCKLSPSKTSRMLSHATTVLKLQEYGMSKKKAEAVSQDTASVAAKYAKQVSWRKVVKFMQKHELCTSALLHEKFDKSESNGSKSESKSESSGSNTPTDSKPIVTINDALRLAEAMFTSDKPIDHATVDYDLVESMQANLAALMENRPS